MVLTSGLATLFCTLLALSSTVSADSSKAASRYAKHRQILASRQQQIGRRANNGKVNMAYFGNWDIYDRGFTPADVPASSLTHLLYSFANIDTDGTVILTDPWADIQKNYAGDDTSEAGTNVYGGFKQFYLLKQQNRHLKVLLSIGGYTYTLAGSFDGINDATWREAFISSAVGLVSDLGLDGLDVDFEYPTVSNIESFYLLLKGLRDALDELAASTGQSILPFELSIAVPAGAGNYAAFESQIGPINAIIDTWNLMAYDYCGSWDTVACDHANLYGNTVNTDAAVNWYVSKGASIGKIVMGMPLYGRGFSNTDGRNTAFTGVPDGDWEAGVYDYKTVAGFDDDIKFQDLTTNVASWTYDSSKRVFVSYDNVDVIKKKATYVKDQGLAGAMFWEVSGDATGDLSLIKATKNEFGTLDTSCNHLYFPLSKYDNIKDNMDNDFDSCGATIPEQSSSSSSSASSTSTSSSSSSSSASSTTSSSRSTTTTSSRRSTTTSTRRSTSSSRKTTSTKKPSATPKPTFVPCSSKASTKGACRNVPIWSKGKWYEKNKKVQCNGRVYQNSWATSAKWGLNTGNAPTVGEKSGAWKQTATC